MKRFVLWLKATHDIYIVSKQIFVNKHVFSKPIKPKYDNHTYKKTLLYKIIESKT